MNRLFRPAVATPVRKEWKVSGVTRDALVALPEKTEGTPIVFAFHGHGGRSNYIARRWKLHELWSEAIVVYPQGLPTRTPRDPNGSRPGWQMIDFGLSKNRDKEFFEAMWETARKKWKCDEKRVYITGHSNGGGFTYYLWAQKPDLFAAVAPVAASGERLIRNAKPCPALIIGAKNDEIVPWEGQEKAIEAVKRLNGPTAPVEVFLHEGGHKYPDAAPARTIAFFKKHYRR
jgi:polyhydroxybutyrate depolymerase